MTSNLFQVFGKDNDNSKQEGRLKNDKDSVSGISSTNTSSNSILDINSMKSEDKIVQKKYQNIKILKYIIQFIRLNKIELSYRSTEEITKSI